MEGENQEKDVEMKEEKADFTDDKEKKLEEDMEMVGFWQGIWCRGI